MHKNSITQPTEDKLKTFQLIFSMGGHNKKSRDSSALVFSCAPLGRVDPVITCTFKARWVACSTLYCFQHPSAEGRREACKPLAEPASLNNEMWVKKRSITNRAGAIQYHSTSVGNTQSKVRMKIRNFLPLRHRTVPMRTVRKRAAVLPRNRRWRAVPRRLR